MFMLVNKKKSQYTYTAKGIQYRNILHYKRKSRFLMQIPNASHHPGWNLRIRQDAHKGEFRYQI